LFLFSFLKLSGNKSKCHYYCSKNGVGIIILSFKKSTYLLLWRSFAASRQHYFALWPRLIVHINLPTRELRLCWQSLKKASVLHCIGNSLTSVSHLCDYFPAQASWHRYIYTTWHWIHCIISW
jgi:hypothetical protein